MSEGMTRRRRSGVRVLERRARGYAGILQLEVFRLVIAVLCAHRAWMGGLRALGGRDRLCPLVVLGLLRLMLVVRRVVRVVLVLRRIAIVLRVIRVLIDDEGIATMESRRRAVPPRK